MTSAAAGVSRTRHDRRQLGRSLLRLSGCLLIELLAASVLWSASGPPSMGVGPTQGEALTVAADPLDVAAGIARWIALVLLAYLAVVTALQLIAVVAHAAAPSCPTGDRLAAVTSRLGPRTLAGVAAAAILVSSSACNRPADAASAGTDAASGTVEMVLEDSGDVGGRDDVVTMQMEATGAPNTTIQATPVPEPTASAPQTTAVTDAPAAPPPLEPVPSAARPTIVAERGDSLWRIAETELSSRLGRPPTDAETGPYWRLLIETNRSQLVDPDDPGLIYPGQRFTVP